MPIHDLTSRHFGRLTVLGRAERPGYATHWTCECACGAIKVIRGCSLTRGASRSCGCLRRERLTTHGQINSRVYGIWRAMRARCGNPNHESFPDYGGRGITVCERWEKSFEAFIADVGEPPTPSHTIDRIDNALGYFPGNVRWATMEIQNSNKRDNHVIEFRGEMLTITQWGKRLGILPQVLHYRIKMGWPIERAMSQTRFNRSGMPMRRKNKV